MRRNAFIFCIRTIFGHPRAKDNDTVIKVGCVMESHKFLLSIEIVTPTCVWSRALLSEYTPTTAELKEYYVELCGIKVLSVSCHAEPVPESFNEALLSVGDMAPTQFPVSDLETTPENTEKRSQYAKYIHQLCELERSRASLCVFTQGETTKGIVTSDTGSNGHVKGALLRTRDWVNELLRSLNPENNDDAIVSAIVDDTVPLGWIVTPVVLDIRDERGSRIILDTELGKKWERLLGTDLYPDLVVSRRISSANWAFQHATSDALVKATLDWYLASQDVKIHGGISDWIARADYEMNMLFSTFKRIKINERFLTGCSFGNDTQRAIFKLLSSVENQCLESALTNPEISPITTDMFRHYMNYLFRGFGITKEVHGGIETVNQILLRWGRGKLGFRHAAEPLMESWKTMWNLVIRGYATAERVQLFLRTLDCWDPIEAGTISLQIRNEIGREWVNIFIDSELVSEAKGSIRSTHLHEKTKEWCYKYLPAGMFVTTFGPMKVGPAFTARGYVSAKLNAGRFTRGLRWKNPANVEQVAPISSASNGTAYGTADGTVDGTADGTAEEKPVIIENTIYLGKI